MDDKRSTVMKKTSVNQKWLDNYDEFYKTGDDALDAWRDLGAVDKANNVVTCCKSISHSTILEVGCGSGSLLKRLNELHFGQSLCGLDIVTGAIEGTRKRGIDTLVECLQFDGSTIPYGANTFDLAILSHVVEHLEHPRRLIYEAARVAKNVFIEVPLEDTLRLKNDYVFSSTGHINFYSYKTFRQLIQTCDLEIVSQKITIPSGKAYQHSLGRKGIFAPVIMKFCLKTFPSIAVAFFTYHCSILCDSRIS